MDILSLVKVSALPKQWWQMITRAEVQLAEQTVITKLQTIQKENAMKQALELVENPVAKAAALAVPSPVDIEDLLSFLGRHPSEVFDVNAKLQSKSNEKNLSWQEKKHIEAIERILSELRLMSHEVKNIEVRHQYPVLPLEPLSWKKQNGLPLLVPFSLNNPVFSGLFETDSWGLSISIIDNKDIPEFVRQKYQKKVKPNNVEFKESAYTFATYFSGLIPISLIPTIQKAKPIFGSIFIIAEASDYHISKLPTPKPRPVNNDPLVVGAYDGILYLIAAFDLTPIENAFVETATTGGFTKLERSRDNIMLHQLAGYIE